MIAHLTTLVATLASAVSVLPFGVEAETVSAAGMPREIAAVTYAGDVMLIDPVTGQVTQRLFKARPPEDPEDPGNFAYRVERGLGGVVFYETGPEPASGTIWRYDPATGQTRRFAEAAAPSLSRDGRYLAATWPTRTVAIYDAASGDIVRTYDVDRRRPWPSDISWNGDSTLYVEFAPQAGRATTGLGLLSLASGEWNYPDQGVFEQPPPLYDPSYRNPERVVALRSDRPAPEPYLEPMGREVVVMHIAGYVNRVLLTGRFPDVSTSNGGKWVVAARADRGFMIVEPDGDVIDGFGTDRRKLVDVDW